MGAAAAAVGAAWTAGALCLLMGLLVPRLIAAIPEPELLPEPVPEPVPDLPLGGPLEPAAPAPAPAPKERYAEIAARPGLAWRAAVSAGLAGALVGGSVGWAWALLPLLPLVPVGVALAVVDWRTRLLPTKVIAPTYAVVVAACLLAGAASGEWSDVVRAGGGWALAGGTFVVLWLVYPRGLGYGDVRLSGVLGLALGYLGWGPLLVGIYAGFLLGGLGGALLSLLRVVQRTAYPFGPFMLLGALVGVVWGDQVAGWYVGRS